LLLYNAALILFAPFASPTKVVELPPDKRIETLSPLETEVEILTIANISILLVVDDGVMVALNPVMSVNDVLVVVN
jgi:hypothetical protein